MRESCEFASAVAAEAREIPVARVGAFLLTIEEYAIRAAAPAVDELRQWVGLASRSGRRAPRRLALPDAHARLVRAAGRAGAAAHAGASTTRRRRCGRCARAGTPPLVYLSFGSVAATIGYFPGLYRDVIDALADLPIRLLVTVGEAADPAELGPLPAHVRAERWIPQAEVFTEADAMVGHGGFGTTMGALLAGVPQVVVPLFADQPYNAQRIAGLGAGLTVALRGPRERARRRRAAARRARLPVRRGPGRARGPGAAVDRRGARRARGGSCEARVELRSVV